MEWTNKDTGTMARALRTQLMSDPQLNADVSARAQKKVEADGMAWQDAVAATLKQECLETQQSNEELARVEAIDWKQIADWLWPTPRTNQPGADA